MTKVKNIMLGIVVLGAMLTVVSHNSLVMAQTDAWKEDFLAPVLDPSWTVLSNLSPNHYSLTDRPGYLRYYLAPGTHTDSWPDYTIIPCYNGASCKPSMVILRDFNGKDWVLRMKVTYNFTQVSNGRQQYTYIILKHSDTEKLIWLAIVRDNDIDWWNRNSIGVSFNDKTTGRSIGWGTKLPQEAQDTWYFEITRSGRTVSVLLSRDGQQWSEPFAPVTMDSDPGDEQTITLEGASFFANTGSYADYDYIYVEPSIWSFVTIPDLPTGASLGRLWTDRPGNLYVWAQTNEPRAILYHWNGRSWSQVLNLPGHGPGYVFGTSSSDIFASAYNPNTNKPKMYHYDGTTWTEQPLPADLIGGSGKIVGEADNIYSLGEFVLQSGQPSGGTKHVIRYDGNSWQTVATFDEASTLAAYINENEIYVIGCWGHTLWDGSSWIWFPGFDFCDVYDIWGMRGEDYTLHLYAVGNTNFSRGVWVWRFIENPPGSKRGSWGCKFCPVFSDPPGGGGNGAGSASGIWGSAPDDIYVIGNRDAVGPTSGRVYHFNGIEWKRITDFGDITWPGGVGGSGPNDVWVSAGDRLLHYGPITVTIDIKPGNVPVAILSSAIFDATTVDRSTVEFAGAHPLPNYCSQPGEIPEDVDGDGLLDIVFYFKTSDLNLPHSDTEACLTGKTFSGQDFRGCDSICRLGPVVGDLNNDRKINFKDFAIFASRWLECTDPNC